MSRLVLSSLECILTYLSRLIVYRILFQKLPLKKVRRWDSSKGNWHIIRMKNLKIGDVFCLEAEFGPLVCLSKPRLGWDFCWTVESRSADINTQIPMKYDKQLNALSEEVWDAVLVKEVKFPYLKEGLVNWGKESVVIKRCEETNFLINAITAAERLRTQTGAYMVEEEKGSV